MKGKKSFPDVRAVLLDVLEKVDRGCPLQEALCSVVVSEKDRPLLSELAYGFVRSRERLFFVIEKFLPKKHKLPKNFYYLLAIAVYSLLFLSRIPCHAAVHSSVELTKQHYGQKLANMANAVLRSFLRKKDYFHSFSSYSLKSDPPESRQLHTLSRFYSLPFWLLRYWKTVYGFSAMLNLAKRSFDRPDLGILVSGVNPELRDRLLLQGEEDARPLGALGLSLSLPTSLPVTTLHAKGLLSFQSVGTQKLLLALGLTRWRCPVWDMCAGFGGKSAFLLSHGVPVVFCSDISLKRLTGLRRDFLRRNLTPPLLFQADAASPPLRSFDGNILLDVPCSGLGILSRRPDIKEKRHSKRSLRVFPPLQHALLESACKYLLPGRELCYITCTLNPEENEERIETILQLHSDLCLVKLWQTPCDDLKTEGMFGALLRRRIISQI
ncbi:MAG: hypothetical protein K5657_03255 [Desulfovibrio sp.]|nr:hypothetical protein [Desulfovibrio sp.]